MNRLVLFCLLILAQSIINEMGYGQSWHNWLLLISIVLAYICGSTSDD